MDKEFLLKDAMILGIAATASALVFGSSMDSLPLRKALAVIACAAWTATGAISIGLAVHVGYVGLPVTRRSDKPGMFWASVLALTAIWLILLAALCVWGWSVWEDNA